MFLWDKRRGFFEAKNLGQSLSGRWPFTPVNIISYTDCSTISAFLVQSLIGFHHIFLVESNRSLFTRIHLCQHLYLVAFHKDRFWVRFFSFYTLPLSLLSSNVIRSSIIHTPMTPNSRTLLLRIAFRTDDKTEVRIISSSRMSTALSIPDSFDIDNASVPFSDTVKNLGVTLDCHLSLKTHVLNLVRTANFELRRIGSIRSLLTTEATATLVSAFILSRLDYCNSLLSGCPRSLILRLQKVQNNAARLILRISKREHISPHLASLHWLPIDSRTKYKLACICYNSMSTNSPPYLSDLLTFYTASRQLRSCSDNSVLRRPTVRTVSYGQRYFAYSAPSAWNALPQQVRSSDNVSTFRSRTKTHLFRLAY